MYFYNGGKLWDSEGGGSNRNIKKKSIENKIQIMMPGDPNSTAKKKGLNTKAIYRMKKLKHYETSKLEFNPDQDLSLNKELKAYFNYIKL